MPSFGGCLSSLSLDHRKVVSAYFQFILVAKSFEMNLECVVLARRDNRCFTVCLYERKISENLVSRLKVFLEDFFPEHSLDELFSIVCNSYEEARVQRYLCKTSSFIDLPPIFFSEVFSEDAHSRQIYHLPEGCYLSRVRKLLYVLRSNHYPTRIISL